MYKFLFYILLFIGLIASASAQQPHFTIKGSFPDIYLLHTVKQGDNYYSLGRKYAISVKAISTVNNRSLDSALRVGQQLKIPLTAQNFLQSADIGSDFLRPVYHLSGGAYSDVKGIGQLYNIPSSLMEQWNKTVPPNTLPANTLVIIGYLKDSLGSKPNLASTTASAASSQKASVAGVNTNIQVNKSKPAEAKLIDTVSNNISKKQEATSLKQSNAGQTNTTLTSANKSRKIDSLPLYTSEFNEGVYKKDYLLQGHSNSDLRSIKASCATLLSSSGWKDAKFYMLINQVTPGTIVKVTYSGKSVYCKVLGAIYDTTKYPNVNAIINSAAAAMLGITHFPSNIDIFYPLNSPLLSFSNH